MQAAITKASAVLDAFALAPLTRPFVGVPVSTLKPPSDRLPLTFMQATATAPCAAPRPALAPRRRSAVACRASHDAQQAAPSRRDALVGLVSLSAVALQAPCALAIDDEAPPTLCSAECASELAQKERVTTPSGLEYQDIVVGTGPSPPSGFQVVVNYIAMTPQGKIFDNSLQRGSPYDIRVGADQVVPGVDEGIRSMQVGGVRRMYVPGSLAYPKGLPAGPGRARVPPASPVIFDVQLLYIPGLE